MEVLGWHQREGILHLTLILPDGTRSFVPAAWTNLHLISPEKSSHPPRPQSDRIATTTALLHVRKIVDALLGNIRSPEHTSQNASHWENFHDKTTQSLVHPERTSTTSQHLENSRSATTKTNHRSSCQPHQTDCLSTPRKKHRGGEK